MKSYSNQQTKRLVRLSLFTAIVILQTWVPMLGYIDIPPVSVTVIHVTTIVAALWLGYVDGAIVGGVWGLNSLIRAFVQGTLMRDIFISPFVSVVPRILMPLIVAYVASKLRKHKAETTFIGLTCGMLGSALNTILVLGAITLFKQNNFVTALGLEPTAYWLTIKGIIVSNGIPEMIAAGIITPAIYRALNRKEVTETK